MQAKRVYNQIVGELLKEPDDLGLQQQLETIRLFLKTADFHHLRAESEKYLTEGKEVVFTVWQTQGKSYWKMTVN